MADLEFNARVKADIQPLAQAAANMGALWKKFAPKELQGEYEKFAKRIGQILQLPANMPLPAKGALGAQIAKDLSTAESAHKKLITTMGTKSLGVEFERAANGAEKLRRQLSDKEAKQLQRTLTNTANSIPKISTALFKVDGTWRDISANAEAYKQKLRTQATIVSDLRAKVADLRKEYDLRAVLATDEAGIKRLGETQNRLKSAEAELTKAVTRYNKDLKREETERDKILVGINGKLATGLQNLKLTKEEEAKLTTSEKLRLITQKQLTAEQERQQKIAAQQAQIDQARRQAYALTIAGGQLKNYGDQLKVLGRESVEAFGNIEYQVLRAAAATSGSSVMVDEMNERAKRLSETMGYFSSEDIAKGMYFFASTTGSAVESVSQLNDMMSKLTPIMNAAAITSSDMETTIKGVYGVLNQFNLPMENAGTVTEQLYYAAQKTAAEFPDFIESLKMLGPVAHQAGVSFEDTLKALALLADSGIRGTMAGRAVRQMFLQLNDPANRATVALDKAVKSQLGLNKSFKDLVFPKGEFIGMQGYIQALATVTGKMNQEQRGNILGIIATAAEVPALTQLIDKEREAMERGTTAIGNNTKGVGDATKARELFASATELVGKSTKAALGRIDNSIRNIKATFGEALAPAIEQLSYALADIAQRFDAFAKANPELVSTIAQITVLGGVIATVGGSILGLVGAILLVTRVAFKEIGLLVGKMTGLGAAGEAAATTTKVVAEGTSAAVKTSLRDINPFTKTLGFMRNLFGGLLTKVKAPFAAVSSGAKASTVAMSGITKVLGGVIGGIAKFGRFLSVTWQAFISLIAGAVVGFFQAISGGKTETEALSGVMKTLGDVFGVVVSAVDVLTSALGLLFEMGRWVGIQFGKLFGDGGPLKIAADVLGAAFGFVGDVLGGLGDVINSVTGELKKLNDDSLDKNKEKLKEVELQILSLKEQSDRLYGPQRAQNEERIKQLEAERLKLVALVNETNRLAEAEALVDFRRMERESLGTIGAMPKPTPTTGNGGGGGGGGTSTGNKQSAREKALELAQQAASLAEALYKIEGLNLKALIRKTMGEVAEAMKLAIKLAAPYAKAFSNKTLEKVGNFATAVGGVASAVGGMVEAATKLAEYKSPKPAAIKRIITDMSIAMTAMVAEAKKFTGSQVAIVQFYADSAAAVVGAVGAAVDAFNSMATGVYNPPERVLKQIAADIGKAVQAFTRQLASSPTQPMLDKAKAFAEAANAVLGTIGAAIGAFKDLRNYVKPLPSMLQAVVDTIDMAIRQMLVSMGRFSLNKDQWEVVNTFAMVARAIADAVGGTYDAFVKQMDFVDQFREEIDYDKVFGWIEMGIKKMADIAAAMPVGMIQMAKDAAEAAQAIAGALDAFFKLATETGGDPALLADSLQTAVNSVLAIIEAFASTTQLVGASFVDSLIAGMQSRESALAAEAARLNAILGGAASSSVTRSNNNTLTINHVVTDPNGVLKNASAAEVAQLLSGDVFITNLQHTIKTQ